eukprot:3097675-Rhodomonas_salina.3
MTVRAETTRCSALCSRLSTRCVPCLRSKQVKAILREITARSRESPSSLCWTCGSLGLILQCAR